MLKCLHCGQEIRNPKTSKGVVVQKFCDRGCKNAYHNQGKTRSQAEAFVKELVGLLKKYRFMEDSASVKET